MDNGPDQEEDDLTRVDIPVTPPEASGQVRIVGAERADEITTELPIPEALRERPDEAAGESAEGFGGQGFAGEDGDPVGEGSERPATAPAAAAFDQPNVRVTDEPGGVEGGEATAVQPVRPGETANPAAAPSTALPHWTEPATGEVPAVLARGERPGGDTGIIPPSWREEDADWVAHEEEFEPSMFGGEHASLGSLDETGEVDVERRPWEFDDLGSGAPGAPAGPIGSGGPVEQGASSGVHTSGEPTIAISRIERETVVVAGEAEPAGPPPTDESIAAASAAPGSSDDEPYETRAIPTGTARPGRARRSVLRPGRLRAKRPEDLDPDAEAPLAAEPPGAAVTEVPGAGRKRVGLAGLAAADRMAERDVGSQAGAGAAVPAPAGVPEEPVAEPPTRAARRRGGRGLIGTIAAGTTGVVAEGAHEATGGGPPPPRRARSGATRRAEPAGSLGLRIGTGLAVAAIALICFKIGTVATLVLAVVIVTFAAGECFGVLRRAGYHPATLLGLVGTISLMVGAYTKGIAALPLVLVLIIVFTLLWYVLGIERGSPVAGTAATLLTIGWVSLLGSYAGLLLAPSTFPDRHGIAFLLGAAIATVANDIGALIVGRWIGRRPLAPAISPNKTWEGFFGGAAVTIVISALVVGNIHPWTPGRAALLGLIVSVVGPIGDLCESLLKRDLRLKDMGHLLPGHGGVLDRVDALLFVLPATYYLVRALNIA